MSSPGLLENTTASPEPVAGLPRFTLPTLLTATRTVGSVFLWGALPLAWAVLIFRLEAQLGLSAFDFKGTIWHPGREILAGHSPYPAPTVAAMDTGNPSVYPPFAFALSVPLALLPLGAAFWVWTTALLGSVLATLRIVGVRDWRCYTFAIASCPVVFGLTFGNIVVLLVPLTAYVWMRRDSRWRSGVVLGLAIALKLVLWPLLIWLLVSRRKGAALVAVASAIGSTLIVWAAIGFDGFGEYSRVLRLNTDLYAVHSWSLLAGAVGLGASLSAAKAITSALGVAVLVFAVVVTRRHDGDRRGFSAALVASVALLPIVWPHSLVVLLVPLALASPVLGRLWFLLGALCCNMKSLRT